MFLRVLLRSGVVAWIEDSVTIKSKQDEQLTDKPIENTDAFYKKIANVNTTDLYSNDHGCIPYHAIDSFKVVERKTKGLPPNLFDVEIKEQLAAQVVAEKEATKERKAEKKAKKRTEKEAAKKGDDKVGQVEIEAPASTTPSEPQETEKTKG